jgi:uncharacterized protein (TIGR02145 family)
MRKKLQKNLLTIFAVIALTLVLSNCNEKDNGSSSEPAAPTATTDSVSFISQTWVTLNGWSNPGNLLTRMSFEYDTDTNQVVFRYKISAAPDTLTGNTLKKRTANLTGLTPNTTYYYRVIAVNSLGETHGTRRKFTTLEVVPSDIVFNPELTYGEIIDIEDNVYKTIQIGAQTWMAQNLAVTKYNDGEPIPLVIDVSIWVDTLATAAYSWYNNIETKYGAIYNWYAVGSGKLCPAGWRVSTDEDWKILTDYLGGAEIAGGKLKETGDVHWTNLNVGATNSSGFTALAGGYRYFGGSYANEKRFGYWWTANEATSKSGIARSMHYNYANIDQIKPDKRTGASVRCVKE